VASAQCIIASLKLAPSGECTRVDGIEALQSIMPQSLCHLGAADMKERYTTLPHHGRIQVWDIENLWQHAKDLPVKLMPLHTISDYDTDSVVENIVSQWASPGHESR
jgi:hypothetical protein